MNDLESNSEALPEISEGEPETIEPVELPSDEDAQDGDVDQEGNNEDEEGQPAELETVIVTGDDGQQYEVPKAIAPAIMKNADYTQKTQTHAEAVRQFEAQKREFEETRKRDEQDFKAQAAVHAVEEQLKTYENVDWNRLSEEQPEEVDRHWRNFQMLKEQRNDLKATVEQRASERTQQQQASQAERVEQVNAHIRNNIPEWSTDLANGIEAYATSIGWQPDSLMSNLTPQLLQTLYDGYRGQQALAKAVKPQPQKNVVPLKTVKAKAGASASRKSPDKMTMDEYAAWRKAN